MKTIKQEGFTIDLEGDSLIIRSGEFKYTAPFTYNVNDIDEEDGWVHSKISLDDFMTMEDDGSTHKDVSSLLLYQLKLDINEVLDDVKYFLDEQSQKEFLEDRKELGLMNAHYNSTRGVK